MGSFLALIGLRIGRALASWGLGSAGGGGAPPQAAIGGPCYAARVAGDLDFDAALAVEVEAEGSMGGLVLSGSIVDLTYTAGVADGC